MPSLETYNLLVVTYDVWLPDRILGIAPKSFWKIFPRLLSLPFAQFAHKTYISIPCFYPYPIAPQNSISDFFLVILRQNISSSTVAWLWMIVHMWIYSSPSLSTDL